MPAKLYRAARDRLLEIWDYSERTWGEAQADAYVCELVSAVHQAAEKKTHWRLLKNRTMPGVYFIRHRNHFIFFRELSGGEIGVISVLHENMDLPSRLFDDANSDESTL
jgi:plasmid stabilization system protein ParE